MSNEENKLRVDPSADSLNDIMSKCMGDGNPPQLILKSTDDHTRIELSCNNRYGWVEGRERLRYDKKRGNIIANYEVGFIRMDNDSHGVATAITLQQLKGMRDYLNVIIEYLEE